MKYAVAIILLLIFIIIHLISKANELSYFKKLRNQVGWAVTQDSGNNLYRGNFFLKYALLNAQSTANIKEPYKICLDDPNDSSVVMEILYNYQIFLSQSYFNQNIPYATKMLSVDEQDFFIFYLNYYLGKNRDDSLFLDHSMKIWPQEYSGNCRNNNHVKYYLTDFSVIVEKLYYITAQYCYARPILKDYVFIDTSAIESIIENKYVVDKDN